MSELRRRVARIFSETPPESPSRDQTPEPGEDVKVIPIKKFQALTTAKEEQEEVMVTFVLGGLFGIVVALLFAQSQDVLKLEGMFDISLDSLIDALPASVIKDARDLTKAEREVVSYDSFSIGLHLQSQAFPPIIL